MTTIVYTLLFISLLLPEAAAAAERPAAGPVTYQLDLRLSPTGHRIEGSTTLRFPAPEPLLRLQLAPDATISQVRVDGRPVGYRFRDGQLSIDGQAGRDATSISIDYTLICDDPLPVDTVGIEDPSFGVRATIRPEGAYLSAGVAWFPQLAERRGTHRVTVTAPAGMLAVTAGRFLGEQTADGTTQVAWRNDFPLAGLALAAGRFQVAQDELDGIQLLTFLTAGNAALAPDYLAAMRRHLVFYRDRLGPYPFAKFAVVENFLPTGYGMPSWTLLGSNVVRLPFLLDTSLPHEIVHSWWGNAIEVDYRHGNWAEGLTTYLADYLLKESTDPAEAREYRRKLLRDYASLVTEANDFPLTAFSGRTSRAEQAVGYGKSAMVFHMLRQTVGDDRFWKTLRWLAAAGNGRELGWQDLEEAFSRESGRNLRPFFARWVEHQGAPVLSLADVQSAASGKGWRVSGTLGQNDSGYDLTVPVRLTATDGGTSWQTVMLTGKEAGFRFDTAMPPATLDVDPDSTLFRRLDPAELPATVNDLTTPQRPLVVVAADSGALRDASRDLLKGLHWDAAEIINERELSPARLAGRDLLYLGWPQRPELRPALPDELVVSDSRPGEWAIDGAPAAGDALFAVLSGRQQQGANRALLLARSPQAAAKITRKISHYGRYSLLLFADGRNLVKSTWMPPNSPLRIRFTKETTP